MVNKFHEITLASGIFERRRRTQMLSWVHAMVQEYLQSLFLNHPKVLHHMPLIEQEVMIGQISATMAVKHLIDIFEEH